MTRFSTTFRAGLLTLLAFLIPLAAQSAPFAAFVMDGRTGKQIHAQNADTRLHPASLTKMMTLYMAFTAIERGQVRRYEIHRIDQCRERGASRLGLRAGQKVELRYLIRAAAIKSANDAATAIGKNLAGSEQVRRADDRHGAGAAYRHPVPQRQQAAEAISRPPAT